MSKIKKILIFTSLCIILLGVGAYVYLTKFRFGKYEYTFKEQISVDTLLTREEMEEDLDYLVGTLNDVHPKTYEGFSEEQDIIIKEAYTKIESSMTASEFYFILNEVICSLKDAHTAIGFNASDDNRAIDLPVVWLNDGIYVIKSNGELQKGDKIVSMKGKSSQDVLNELEKITPSENTQWIKVRRRFDLTQESFLNYLEVIEEDYVPVTIERDGKAVNLKLPLKRNIKYEVDDKEDWVTYDIDKDNDLGVFKLDTCTYNEEYKFTLESFFKEVTKNEIDHIVIDIRENTGGNSQVLNEFMKYINIDEYMDYSGDIRYSEQASEQRGHFKKDGYKSYSKNTTKNKKISNGDLIYDGEIYILTSPRTFSSGNWFAVVMRDNELGKIIGESTGNQPSSYGDILLFQVPNSRFKFQVSYKKFVRPNTDNDPENALHPDIEVYTTIEDILNDRDPQIEKVIEIIN